MVRFPVSGANAQIAYGWETTFNVSGVVNKAFSQGVRVTTYDVDNDPEFVYEIGSQDVQKSIAKTFKGTWGVEFLYSDPWWLRGILGGAPTTAGSYVHTWTIANGGITNTQPSLTIIYGFDLDVDSNQILTGCIINSVTITCTVGEPIRVRLEGWYSGIIKGTTLATKVLPVEDPMTFAYGTFKMPNLITISDVQSVELTWNRNNEPVYAIGSRFPQNNVAKAREWNIKLNSTYEADADFWDKLLGSTTVPSTTTPAEIGGCALILTNSGAGSAERSITISFTPTFIHRGSIPSSPEDLVKVDIDARARSISSVIVVNNTSTAL